MANNVASGIPASADLLIRGATVIDPRDGSRAVNQDVCITGDRIVNVGAATDGDGPTAAQTVQAQGRYLIPGLVDMHAHPLVMKDPQASLQLMLAFGITGYRQMSGSVQILKERGSGAVQAHNEPKLLATPGAILTPLNAGTAAAAVATIREQKELGADFIKAGLVASEVFYQAQAEAARLDIPILGHLPAGIDVFKASGQGMKSIEHLGPGVDLLACCSSAHDDLHAMMKAVPTRKLPPIKLPFMETIFDHILLRIVINPVNMARQPDIDVLDQACSTFDQDAAGRLAERLAADGTWQVPTLIRSRTNYTCDDPKFADDPNRRYVAPATLKSWTKATKKFTRFPEASRQTFRLTYATLLALAKLLDDAGVKMLAGSDACGAAWEVPGAALHQEFDELAKAGLTPLRVLQMTTSDPAEFLGATADMGSVSAGKYADIVLLHADPLQSVANLHSVAGVVRSGHYFDHQGLQALKENVASKQQIR